MRAVLQRVLNASVQVDQRIVGSIGPGWLVLLGVAPTDSDADLEYISDKIINLRGFGDAEGKMNLSVMDTSGEVLVVSQFTLYGDCRKGRRPSFSGAGGPEFSNDLYLKLVRRLTDSGIRVATGQFQAHMQVSLVNDGPVTFVLDSSKII
jgi:D-tyrosyl-tRNA(Tyr) deacylase